jgi:poly [ADP-ribose] polymerase 2/3/4
MSRAKKQKTEAADSEPAEIKVQIAKNGIPLDEIISQHLKASHHVLRVGDEIWDAKLNMSNSTDNNNKFYIIQLLEPDNVQEGNYYVWNRWGRVGESAISVVVNLRNLMPAFAGYAGQNSLEGPMSKDSAQRQFGTKFKSKTSADWKDRDSMVRNPKKYYYLKTSYDFKTDAQTSADPESSERVEAPAAVECKLHARLQDLVKLVCNVDEMAKQMSEVSSKKYLLTHTHTHVYLS